MNFSYYNDMQKAVTNKVATSIAIVAIAAIIIAVTATAVHTVSGGSG